MPTRSRSTSLPEPPLQPVVAGAARQRSLPEPPSSLSLPRRREAVVARRRPTACRCRCRRGACLAAPPPEVAPTASRVSPRPAERSLPPRPRACRRAPCRSIGRHACCRPLAAPSPHPPRARAPDGAPARARALTSCAARLDLVRLAVHRAGRRAVLEAEPVEVARGEQVHHVVLLGARARVAVCAAGGRPALTTCRRVRQLGRVEPRLRAPVERAGDVLRVGVAALERLEPEAVLDHLQDRLEAEDRCARRGRAARRATPRLPGCGCPSGRSPCSGRGRCGCRARAAGARGRRSRPTRRRR